jgi:hypothetical protein
MIANATEYEKAQDELRSLEERLRRLQQAHPVGLKGFTKAGIRKLIARLHEEMAVYEGSEEAKQPDPSDRAAASSSFANHQIVPLQTEYSSAVFFFKCRISGSALKGFPVTFFTSCDAV